MLPVSGIGFLLLLLLNKLDFGLGGVTSRGDDTMCIAGGVPGTKVAFAPTGVFEFEFERGGAGCVCAFADIIFVWHDAQSTNCWRRGRTGIWCPGGMGTTLVQIAQVTGCMRGRGGRNIDIEMVSLSVYSAGKRWNVNASGRSRRVTVVMGQRQRRLGHGEMGTA